MELFTWSEALSVGNEFIDRDHQQLIALINTFHEAVSQQRDREAIETSLDRLIDYTRAHFAREEAAMQRIGYDDYPLHKQEHDVLIRDAVELKDIFTSGMAALSIKVSTFLKYWLLTHIMQTDRLLAQAIARTTC
jgi:hemerythrin